MKVSPAFSKAAGSRDSVPGRAPLKRGTLLVLTKAQEGVQGGTLAGGSPFSLRFYVCADTLGGGRWPALPFDPISLVLAQRNGVEPPKKSAFLPWRLHHPRERCCLGGRGSSSPDLGQGTGAGLGPLRRLCGGSTVPVSRSRFAFTPHPIFAQQKTGER